MRRLRWQLRTWAGRDVKPRVELDCALDSCDANSGGWTICPNGLSKDAIVYSFGIGEDVSWERYMIDRFGATVHAFDPTPRSLQWLQGQTLPQEFVGHAYGLADYDGEAQFSPPEKGDHVDHTLLARPATAHRAIPVPVVRLATVMQRLGHDHLDLLKMDIEGAEYGAINDIVSSEIAIRQLLIEFHHRFPQVGTEHTKRALRQLHGAGYRIFAISDSGQEYGFLREA